MQGKIAVLGDTDFVMPFSALGVDTYTTTSSKQIRESAGKIIDGSYALIVVAENVATVADEVFSEYEGDATPCVVVVPFTTESEGFATEALAKVLKLATGVNILQNS
jgi:V/A-type H+-transporting ATPase subunit F